MGLTAHHNLLHVAVSCDGGAGRWLFFKFALSNSQIRNMRLVVQSRDSRTTSSHQHLGIATAFRRSISPKHRSRYWQQWQESCTQVCGKPGGCPCSLGCIWRIDTFPFLLNPLPKFLTSKCGHQDFQDRWTLGVKAIKHRSRRRPLFAS
jgi:hypothetical protein